MAEQKKDEQKTTPSLKQEKKEAVKPVDKPVEWEKSSSPTLHDAQGKLHDKITKLSELRISKAEKWKEKEKINEKLAADAPVGKPAVDAKKTDDEKTKEEIAAEWEALQALTEKHNLELEDALHKFDYGLLSEETKISIHADAVSDTVDVAAISEQDRQNALKELDSDGEKSIDVKNLDENQIKIVQKYQAKKHISALAQIAQSDREDPKKLDLKLQELEEINPGITDFVKKNGIELLTQSSFFEAAKKDQKLLEKTIESIKSDWFLASGIDPESPLGNKLREIIKSQVTDYLSIYPPKEGVIDVENFIWLKDILGWSYNDLLFGEKFILWDDHPLKKARDTILTLFRDEVAQIDTPENPESPEQVQKYKDSVQETMTNVTGVDSGTAERMAGKVSRWSLSPFVRLLADIIAPIGALMGGEVGDFWRKYLSESDMGKDVNGRYGKSGTPIEWKWIENAKASDILAAAQKYEWKSESSDPDLIREMHRYAGLNAGPGAPWCMSFIQYVLRKEMWFNSAQIGPPTAWAADGHSIGRHTETPKPWDIVLIRRSGGSGRHIWFVQSINSNWSVEVLGGNQSNSVMTKTVSAGSIVEFRSLEVAAPGSATDAKIDYTGGNKEVMDFALQKQKEGQILWAVHCTDWVDKVYRQTVGTSVYNTKLYYDWVRKIWGWTGIGWDYAPEETIQQIVWGQHIIVDKPPYHTGKTHSVIALWSPSDWLVKVVSYPNNNIPPRLETYDLRWQWRGDKDGRVLRIQGV